MKIDHIALYVNDLEGAKAFFETYSMRLPMRAITMKKPIFVPIF